MNTVHDSAATGYTAAAQTYVRGRPDYPTEAGEWLREIVELAPGKSVLDLGAGTLSRVPNWIGQELKGQITGLAGTFA